MKYPSMYTHKNLTRLITGVALTSALMGCNGLGFSPLGMMKNGCTNEKAQTASLTHQSSDDEVDEVKEGSLCTYCEEGTLKVLSLCAKNETSTRKKTILRCPECDTIWPNARENNKVWEANKDDYIFPKNSDRGSFFIKGKKYYLYPDTRGRRK